MRDSSADHKQNTVLSTDADAIGPLRPAGLKRNKPTRMEVPRNDQVVK